MRISRYQVVELVTISTVDGPKEIRCRGGSNVSQSEAVADAHRRAEVVRRRIAGEVRPADTEYEVEIREEILDFMDEQSVVTRNRYGASVLNTTALTIIDIDQAKRRWFDFFGGRPSDPKKAMLESVKRAASQGRFSSLGFRAYETAAGLRVIVLGRYLAPDEADTKALFKALNGDPLYESLCRRQGCYRARLTPKPHRMKQERRTFVWPRPEEDDEAAKRWLDAYASRGAGFAVCRYLETFGRNHPVGRLVQFHDRETGVGSALPLA